MIWIKWLTGAAVVGGFMALCLFFWPFEPLLLRVGVPLDGYLERLLIGALIGGAVVGGFFAFLAARERKIRRLKYEEEMRKRRQSKLKGKDQARWTKDHDDLSRIFDKLEALPKMPHVFKKLKAYWGYPEFLEMADDMLTMEAGREGRQGFDPKIHQELAALRQFYIQNIEKVMAPSLTEVERNRIRQRIRKYN